MQPMIVPEFCSVGKRGRILCGHRYRLRSIPLGSTGPMHVEAFAGVQRIEVGSKYRMDVVSDCIALVVLVADEHTATHRLSKDVNALTHNWLYTQVVRSVISETTSIILAPACWKPYFMTSFAS